MKSRPGITTTMRMCRHLGPAAAVANAAVMSRRRGVASVRLGRGRSMALRRGTTDWEAFEEVLLDGIYADDFAQLFGRARDRSSIRTVLDLGAHVGCSSLYFADRYPRAEVCAVEADPDNVKLLRRNVAGCDRISVVEGAVWSDSTMLDLGGDATRTTGRHVRTASGTGAVRGVTVPELLDRTGWQHVDVAKIDIEGSERAVFGAGDVGWLKAVDMIMIELHDWKTPGSSRAFHAAVADDFDEFVLDGVIAALRTPSP